MAKKIRNLGEYSNHDKAKSDKAKLENIAKKAGPDYYLEVKPFTHGKWTLWLMKN